MEQLTRIPNIRLVPGFNDTKNILIGATLFNDVQTFLRRKASETTVQNQYPISGIVTLEHIGPAITFSVVTEDEIQVGDAVFIAGFATESNNGAKIVTHAEYEAGGSPGEIVASIVVDGIVDEDVSDTTIQKLVYATEEFIGSGAGEGEGEEPGTNTMSIEGVVLDVVSGLPVADATVRLATNLMVLNEVSTDEFGHFLLGPVNAFSGIATIHVLKYGYESYISNGFAYQQGIFELIPIKLIPEGAGEGEEEGPNPPPIG